MAKRDKTNPKSKRRALRQVALLNNLFMGSSITRAVRKARFCKKWPGQAGYQALQDPKLKMPELLEGLGLGDTALIDKYLKSQLNARTVQFFQYKGKVTDMRILPDNNARHRGLDMALQLSGAYPPTDPKLEQPVGVKVIIVDVPRPGGRNLTNPAPAQLPSPENRS